MAEPYRFAVTVSMADDYYKAYLNLQIETPVPQALRTGVNTSPPLGDQASGQQAEDEAQRILATQKALEVEIYERLSRLNIVEGIDRGLIAETVKGMKAVEVLEIARGVPHVHGKDAALSYHINFEGKAKPAVLEDGTVDFKNMLQSAAVTKGMCLATKTPVQPGSDGLTVTGKVIKHRPGKDLSFKFGENVVASEDGLMLFAAEDGIAKMTNGRLSVLRVIELSEVGPESGNIYFGGDVHVRENVLDGYTIHCDGDLTIDGVVEGCTLKVKGNLVVGKGILGHGMSDIVVGGSLVAKFIENATVYVKGEIETGEIINSKVLCDSKILVKGKKGLIIGGEITSKYMIEANHIGSRLGVLTTINLGVDATVIEELKALKETVQELKILEQRLMARLPVLKDNVLRQPEVGVHEDMLQQYEESLRSTQMDLEEKQQRLEQLMEALKKVNQGKVKINSIFPDTVVRIGNSKYFVDKALSACIITKADDKVIAIGTKEDKG